MAARLIMVQGVSSNAGKSIIAGALCRYLLNCGVRVAPFKPILVCTGDLAENGIPTDARFMHILRAARVELHSRCNPMQILATHRDWLGQIMSPASLRFPDGEQVPIRLFGRDTPLFSEMAEALRNRITQTVNLAITELARESDTIVIEGAGNPTDLGEDDLTNFRIAREHDIATVLVTKLSVGGGPASLVGTFELLPPQIRRTVVGFILNDFLDGESVARGVLERLEKRLGVPCLGIYPNLWSVQPWTDKEGELEGLANLVKQRLNLAPLGLGLTG